MLWAGIAQSVWRLTTGWTIRGSKPSGVGFSASVQTGHVAHTVFYTMGNGFLSGEGGADGVNWPERDFDHPPPSSVEVKSGPTPTVILSDFLNAPFCYDIERLFSLR